MTTSEQIDEVATAMSKAQGEMRPAIKDAINPAFRSKYADLAAVWDACRGPLAKHGLSAWQDVTLGERGVSVVTRIVHTSGQWVECGPLTVPLSKQDAHGVGSATSYAKRYALSAMLGIVAEDDDDANTASAPRQQARPEATVPQGYGDWIADMEAAADEGVAALEAAFKASKVEYRKHAASIDQVRWNRVKSKAQAAKGAAA